MSRTGWAVGALWGEEKPFTAEQLLSSITENERKPLLVNHCQPGQELALGESPPEQG